MEAMRQSWTDERLDDFRGEVGRRFDSVDQRFDAVDQRFGRVESNLDGLRGDLGGLNGDLGGLRAEMRSGFARIDERFESLYRLLLQSAVALLVGLFGVVAALVGIFATQI